MSWDGPDREHGPPVTGKPYCTTRPTRSALPEDQEAVEKYLSDRGLDPGIAARNGWYPSRVAGDAELRVVIPCLSADLTNRYWQGRRLTDSKDKFPLRYTSPHNVKRGDALAVVVNGEIERKGTVLVEGPMDALAAAGVGYLGIGWMGTDPGNEPIELARRIVVPNQPVYVVSDKDAVAAGVRIWAHFIGAFLVNPYPFKDLAAMPKLERQELLRR